MTTDPTETARLHDEILTLRAEVAQCRGLLRTENERMRHELQVMYGGAFDSPPTDRTPSAATEEPR